MQAVALQAVALLKIAVHTRFKIVLEFPAAWRAAPVPFVWENRAVCHPSTSVSPPIPAEIRPGHFLSVVVSFLALGTGAQVRALRAQELFDPGVPPVRAAARLPGELATETPRKLAGNEYFLNNVPYVPGPSTERKYYNFKLGNLSGTVYAATSLTYSDNVLYVPASGAEGDWIVTPSAGVGIYYPFSQFSELEVSLGAGYSFYQSHSELNRVTASIVPRSAIHYRLAIGEVLVTLYNHVDVAGDFQDRPELRGDGRSGAVDFNRILNRTGISANWAVNPSLTLASGYAFGMERGLGDSYSQLDSNSHTWNLAAYELLGKDWTVGVWGAVSMVDYLEHLQNDARSYATGPLVAWRPTEFLSLSAQVGYTITEFDATSLGNQGSTVGVIDTSEFRGITFQVGANHRINRSMTHSLTVGRGVNNGLGSNFTDAYHVGYGITWALNDRVGITAGAIYTAFEQSQAQRVYIGPIAGSLQVVDRGDHATFHIGTAYPFSRKLRGALNYAHEYRFSEHSPASYHVNTVTLALTYSF